MPENTSSAGFESFPLPGDAADHADVGALQFLNHNPEADLSNVGDGLFFAQNLPQDSTGSPIAPQIGTPMPLIQDTFPGDFDVPFRSVLSSTIGDSGLVSQGSSRSTSQTIHISTKTQIDYESRVKALHHYSSKARTIDQQNPVEPTPLEVTQDLILSAAPGPNNETPIRSSVSFSIYRAALLWHLHARRHQNELYELAYRTLATTKVPSGRKKKSSFHKLVYMDDDFSMLVNVLGTLDKRTAQWGSRTSYWIQATVACGARCIEWNSAEWLDRDKFQMTIKTAKKKLSKPAFVQLAETTRTDVFSIHDLYEDDNAEDDQIDVNSVMTQCDGDQYRIIRVDRNDATYIDLHLNSIEIHSQIQRLDGVDRDRAFHRYYEMCRRTLRKACLIAFKGSRFYPLKVGRKQFSANMKIDNSIGVVAALMGHTNTRTTMRNYGSRYAGLKSRKAQSDVLGQVINEAFNINNLGNFNATNKSAESAVECGPSMSDT